MRAPTGQGLAPGQINEVFERLSNVIDYTFSMIFGGPGNWAKDLVTSMETDLDFIDLPFLESIVGLNPGKRGIPVTVRSLQGGNHRIQVEKFEDGFEIDIHDLIADRLNLYMPRAQDLAAAAAFLLRDRIVAALVNGETILYTLYDDVPWFDNTHPKGGTTFDNLQSGLLSATNLQANRVIMMRFPSDKGDTRPLNIIPNWLFVAPEDERLAMELINNTFVPGGAGEADNFFRAIIKVQVIPELTDSNDWYLMASDKGVKPLLHLKKKGLSPFRMYRDGDITENEAFKHELIRVWGFTYEEAFPTRPEFALKVVNA